MATFPAVIPDAKRTFTPGVFGAEGFSHPSGVEVRFLTSTQRVADRLSLLFDLRDEATVELIREHYLEQAGGTLPFDLSSDVLLGFPSGDTLAPSGFGWVYVEPPQIEHAAPRLFRIIVQLESVNIAASANEGTPGGSSTPLEITYSISGGAASAGRGTAFTVSAAITAGAAVALAADGSADGATLTITASVATRGLGGGGSGAALSMTVSVDGGAASGD